ncbi:MAG: RsmE family RNA methyltransferase [Verrucomicrobiota bacterium]
MHRFYLPAEKCEGKTLTLLDHEAHHAAQVLRVRPNEKVLVLDGVGHQFICEVGNVLKKSVSLTVTNQSFTEAFPFKITLIQAIPKGKIFDSIIQKATELGVARIVPLLSERVTTQLDEENGHAKLEKWRHTTIEAMKQCGQPWLPWIDAPISLPDFLKLGERFELPMVGSLKEGSRHPREYFETFLADKKRAPISVCIWIGPEGDFTSAEMDLIKADGVLPITLGRLVLRCETAAIYCLSVLNYELGAASLLNGHRLTTS